MKSATHMNKSESKYHNTACLMDEALLQLLQRKDYDYITVRELCKMAGVNRSTFYLHYETMDDLLSESLSYIFGKFTEKYKGLSFTPDSIREKPENELLLVTPPLVIPYLEFIKENKRLFITAAKNPALFRVEKHFEEIYTHVFEPILQRFGVPESERKYLLAYHISGAHAIITEWIKGGCTESTELIADFIVRYVKNKS